MLLASLSARGPPAAKNFRNLLAGGAVVNGLFTDERKGMLMLHYAVVFFVIALIAALFGFGGIAAGAAEIAKLFFFVFLVLFVASLLMGLVRRGPES
jgi:uncharacterized membrane protein YtjA (UPF0391 family)